MAGTRYAPPKPFSRRTRTRRRERPIQSSPNFWHLMLVTISSSAVSSPAMYADMISFESTVENGTLDSTPLYTSVTRPNSSSPATRKGGGLSNLGENAGWKSALIPSHTLLHSPSCWRGLPTLLSEPADAIRKAEKAQRLDKRHKRHKRTHTSTRLNDLKSVSTCWFLAFDWSTAAVPRCTLRKMAEVYKARLRVCALCSIGVAKQ